MDLIPVIVYIFYLSISLSSAFISSRSPRCPNRCLCTPDTNDVDQGLIISCKWSRIAPETRQFAHFPQNITRTLNIECEDDSISEFTDDSFAEFKNLLSLRIQSCRTRQLPANLFRGLTALRSLYLIKLGLPKLSLTLTNGIFDDLMRLEMLYVVDSNVEAFPNGALCKAERLRVLNVSSNWLTSANIGLKLSCSLKQLIVVDLENNRIKAINSYDFASLRTIHQLSLADNQIERIDADSLRASHLLQELAVQNNRLSQISFLPDSIMNLNAANNRLTAFPDSIAQLRNLVSLNLSGNPIGENIPASLQSLKLQDLDLSNSNLGSIPENLLTHVMPSLRSIAVASNQITQLPVIVLQNFKNLQKLDASSNSISKIADGTFNLPQLSHLNLSNNSLSSLPALVFDTSHVTEIDLSGNAFTEVPFAVSRLSKLRKLDLSNNQISNINKFLLNKLPLLQSINMENNKLLQVEPYVFNDLPHLTELSLTRNSLKSLSPDAFAKCPRLLHLDLSFNKLSSLNDSLLNLPELEKLNISNNLFSVLEWTQLPKSLITLDASGNLIVILGMARDAGLSVAVAKLENNRIKSISSRSIPDSLEYLNLSWNSVDRVFDGTFKDKTNLRSVDLRHNKLQNISQAAFSVSELSNSQIRFAFSGNPLECSCEMGWLKVPGSAIRDIIEVVDEEATFCYHTFDKRNMSLSQITADQLYCPYEKFCEISCRCCEFSNCDCHSKCPPGCQCYRNTNSSLNIVRCSALEGEVRERFDLKNIPMLATHIYLEKLNIPVIKKHSFFGRPRVQQIHINSSSVRSIEAFAFKSLSSLKLLDLSDNELDRFIGDELYMTPEITHLFLNNNRIRMLSSKMRETFPDLQVATLHNNRLQDIPQVIEDYGDKILKISLSGNPFRCDCNNRFKIQSWLPENLNKVVDATAIECIENVTRAYQDNDTTILSARPPNRGNDVFVMYMLEFIERANRSICVPAADGIFGTNDTTNSILLAVGIAVSILAMIGLIIVARSALRKTHAAMAQRRYKCPPSLNCSQITPGSSPIPLIHFDAFISYAKKDEKLVIDALCRQLEYEEYLLCLLHRDGPAYNIKLHSVSDELINQMECSKALILVLTQNFLDGEWKTLQIKTSHRLFAKNRSKKLIALLGDGIEPNQLDPELGQILRKNTCIRMSDPLFWNLLHSALPERISPSSCSGDSSQIYSDCYGTIVPSDVL